MMYILITVYGICKTILPLLIQLSIKLFNTYQHSLYLITIISIMTFIYLLILSTPKHDHYRTLKKDLSSSKLDTDLTDDELENEPENEINSDKILEITEKSKQAALALKSDKFFVYTQRGIIFILSLIMTMFSATQRGLVNFITTYCNDYLFIDESIGRYMISGYYGGQLLYRLLVAVCIGDRLKEIWLPTRTITSGFIMMNILLVLITILDKNLIMILIVYIGFGFFASGIFPDIFKWCEFMTPLSSIFSCIFIAGFSGGDALVVFIIGELIQKYGHKYYHIHYWFKYHRPVSIL